MEKHSPVIVVQPDPIPSHIDILTDALVKCKERFDKAAQDDDASRLCSCVSQMTQLSYSITEATKAERESRIEQLVRECTEAVDDLADDLADLSIELIRGDEDVTF